MSALNKKNFSHLIEELKSCTEEEEKKELLKTKSAAKDLLKKTKWQPYQESLVALSLMAIGQEHLLPVDEKAFLKIERYYAPIGGLIGYHQQVLSLLEAKEGASTENIEKAPGPDLREESFICEGIAALEKLGEVYPVGGLGSRLDFRAADGTPLPAALLPFEGRTLLEGLIRDVQAKEELYFKVYGKKITIPIGLMTSSENQKYVELLCHEHNWFGRPKESFFLFPQLSVPVITDEGIWTNEMEPNGHGALWHTAQSSGLFDWFEKKGVEHLLIRQINNPIGGVNGSLLSFLGHGVAQKKTFGFAACDRLKNAAEGVLVLVDQKHISNIEYTHLKAGRLSSAFPANTNILYVNLKKILPIIHAHPLQGLMINMKNNRRGRLESMMQSISDVIEAKEAYLTYNSRRQTISSAKRKFQGDLLETPEGAFFDQMWNAHELLEQCGVKLPKCRDEMTFLAKGPAVYFTYHPKLGPLYDIIKQKICGGEMVEGSELCCELSELILKDLHLEGSLLIKNAACKLKDVTVKNLGKRSCAWDGSVDRIEATLICGEGEFYAEGVTLEGNQLFEIPKNERWILTSAGLTKEKCKTPTWSTRIRLIGTTPVVDFLDQK